MDSLVDLVPCNHASGGPCRQYRDVDLFVGRIGTYRNISTSLEKDIRALCSALNHSHDPFIHKLPSEISSKIFTHCLIYPHSEPDSRVQKSAPLVLGAVCRTWRQIAWSTAQLWSAMSFDLWIERCNDHALRIELVKEWLGRSGELPLYISIQAPGLNTDHAKAAPLLPLVDILCSYSSRWRVLSLYAPPSFLSRFNPGSLAPHGRGLSELHIESSIYPVSDPINLTSVTPYLLKLSFGLIDLSSLHIRFDHLTDLTAAYLFSDECLELIRHAPLLEECTFDWMGCAEQELSTELLLRPKLRDLSFEGNGDEDLRDFLSKLHLPGLERLNISSPDIELRSLNLASHFERWGCPLKTLLLGDRDSEGEDMKTVLGKVPTLEYLHLYRTHHANVALRDVLQVLADRFQTDEEEGTVTFLPRLKTMKSFNTASPFFWAVLPEIFGVDFKHVDSLAAVDVTPRSALRAVTIYRDSETSESEPDLQEVGQDIIQRCRYLQRFGIMLDIYPPIF